MEEMQLEKRLNPTSVKSPTKEVHGVYIKNIRLFFQYLLTINHFYTNHFDLLTLNAFSIQNMAIQKFSQFQHNFSNIFMIVKKILWTFWWSTSWTDRMVYTSTIRVLKMELPMHLLLLRKTKAIVKKCS